MGLPSSQSISPESLELARRFHDKLAEFGRLNPLRDPIATMVEAMGFTPPQLHSVLWLGRDRLLTMGELASRVGVTDKTVTGIVDRLERDGYAHRVRPADDRRVVQVELTEKGREAFQTLSDEMLRKVACFLAALDPEECQVLFRIVERLTTLAAAALAGEKPDVP